MENGSPVGLVLLAYQHFSLRSWLAPTPCSVACLPAPTRQFYVRIPVFKRGFIPPKHVLGSGDSFKAVGIEVQGNTGYGCFLGAQASRHPSCQATPAPEVCLVAKKQTPIVNAGSGLDKQKSVQNISLPFLRQTKSQVYPWRMNPSLLLTVGPSRALPRQRAPPRHDLTLVCPRFGANRCTQYRTR